MSEPGPGGHDLSAGGDVMERVTACARAALRRYDGHPDALKLRQAGERFSVLPTI